MILPSHTQSAATLFLAFCASAEAVVIRDDIADSQYISLGSEAAFPASGVLAGGLGGTLIDPFYVLTAAHIQGSIAPGITTFSIGGLNYVITEQHPHPNYDPATFENDINVLKLGTPVTNVTPAPYYTGSLELGREIISIGYGLTGNGLTGATGGGGRRGAMNTVDAFGFGAIFNRTSLVADFDNPPGITLPQGGLGSVVPTPLEGTLAGGDSGGGVYANFGSGQVLIGINSFVGAVDGSNNSDYGDLFGATRVSLYDGFIRSQIPEPTTAALLAGGALLSTLARQRS